MGEEKIQDGLVVPKPSSLVKVCVGWGNYRERISSAILRTFILEAIAHICQIADQSKECPFVMHPTNDTQRALGNEPQG